jgi:myosin-crossreactive antigen
MYRLNLKKLKKLIVLLKEILTAFKMSKQIKKLPGSIPKKIAQILLKKIRRTYFQKLILNQKKLKK